MTELTAENVLDALQLLEGVFPTYGKEIGPHAVKGWMIALEGLSREEVSGAVKGWIQTGEKFPIPADLRKITQARRDPLPGIPRGAANAGAYARTMVGGVLRDPFAESNTEAHRASRSKQEEKR